MSKNNNSHHIVPNSTRGGWDIRRGNSERSSGHFNTQAEAISVGTEIARNQATELRIHGRNGQIRESNSFGNDPCPPKDKK